MNQSFQIIPIDKVFESPLNPRKTFNEKKMEELVESVRAKGIMVPLLVRPCKDSRIAPLDRFEIAAGHRRYRAAIALKLTEVPLLVREMSDSDFLEVLTIENLQHEDVLPLDEAQGFRMLMEKTNYDVAAISLKVGKSESWIYQRMKLLDLIPEAQEQLSKEKITAGHAILIARLQPDQQKEVLKEALFERYGRHDHPEAVSVRDLADYIETNIHLDLNSASFKKNDPDLLPEAGACPTCPNRTGFIQALFPDIKKKDTCTDRDCFYKKVEAFIAQWLKQKSQDTDTPPLRLSGDYNYRAKKISDDPENPIPSNLFYEITDKKKQNCQYTQEGIVVEGRRQGQVLLVCIDPECKKHHERYTPDPEMNKWRAQQRAADEKKKQQFKVRESILDATLAAWPGKFTREDLLILAAEVYRPIWHENQKKILKRKGLTPKKEQYSQNTQAPMATWLKDQKEKELQRFLLECVLFQNLDRHWTDKGKADPLLETAARYGVNPKAIEAEFKGQAKTKKAEKKGKKKAKAKSGVCRVCGCTDDTPCEGPGGVLCHWADRTKTLCSVCRDKGVNEEVKTLLKEEHSKKKVHTSAKKKK